jgi:hypothetical protein
MRIHSTLLFAATAFATLACSGDPQKLPVEPIAIAGVSAAVRESEEWSTPTRLPAPVNSTFNEIQPSLSKDGLSLYFVSRRTGTLGANDIWVSHRDCRECDWQTPVNPGAPINSATGESSPRLSRNGHYLFFGSNRPGGQGQTDLYVSYRENVNDDFGWQAPNSLGPNVNTTGNEGSPTYLEKDDLSAPQLYFDRQSGAGQVPNGDIYVSELQADGTWGPATFVTELNSTVADNFPSIDHFGLTLYFWSNRRPPQSHIFVARRASVLDPWGTPVEIGPPVSTSEGEVMPWIHSHGHDETLLHVRDDLHNGNFDIYVSTRRTSKD